MSVKCSYAWITCLSKQMCMVWKYLKLILLNYVKIWQLNKTYFLFEDTEKFLDSKFS